MSEILHDLYDLVAQLMVSGLSLYAGWRWFKRDTDEAICCAVFTCLIILQWKLV